MGRQAGNMNETQMSANEKSEVKVVVRGMQEARTESKMPRRLLLGLAGAAAGVLIASTLCGALGAGTGMPVSSAWASEQTGGTVAAVAPSGSETSAAASATTVIDESAYNLETSNRDNDPSYDAASAVAVTLSDSASTVSPADGVTVDGSTITVSAAGTYVLTGTLTDGTVVVNAPEDAKVQLVLAGASIANADGPAIQVAQADKCFVTLADGTDNSLSDGSVYADTGEDAPNAALWSTCDLTINGSGALTVTGSYKYGISTKDDLAVTGGIVSVRALDDALRGHDSVLVTGGTLALTSQEGDGIASKDSDDLTHGYVSIDGGTLTIEAGDDGIQASHYLRVTGGSLGVDSSDDALHSDGDARIVGGTLVLSAGDDGVHAEGALVIDGGDTTIVTCYEGLEGNQIYMNDGSVDLTSSDDGVNAASPSTGDADQIFGRGGMGGGMENDASCLVQINGGTLVVDAQGDGLDSNGTLEINGGTVFVSGPTGSDNGALDFGGSGTVNGGTVIIAGNAGMAQNFTGGTQPFVLVEASGQAGSTVTLSDASGTQLATFAPTKAFSLVIASAPQLSEGDSCTVTVDGTDISATASTTPSSMAGMGGMGGMGGMDRAGGMGRMGDMGNMGGMGGMPTDDSTDTGNMPAGGPANMGDMGAMPSGSPVNMGDMGGMPADSPTDAGGLGA